MGVPGDAKRPPGGAMGVLGGAKEGPGGAKGDPGGAKGPPGGAKDPPGGAGPRPGLPTRPGSGPARLWKLLVATSRVVQGFQACKVVTLVFDHSSPRNNHLGSM
eukprot:gene12287-biopygen3639